ncbi:AfsR/SARP family transcriptional regulator [Nonomuraea salmonea]|uniref:AfsR/SARP family transcriptional regulator n=1 Tax=Nonomuraea salmonea TaxID=46181 RepID=UPI002FE7AB41
MEFRVLGTVQVLDGGQAVPVASRRQEQLLALLVCRAGRAVTTETLIDELWPERAGPATGKNLQVLVHRLRRTLGDPGRVVLDRSGYRLRAQVQEVDAWHFTDLAEHGQSALRRHDAAGAADLLGRALALWRGPAFSGLTEVGALADAAALLERQRRQALTARMDAEMALGRHAEIVPEAAALLAEDPLDEPVAARLMTALHHSGQRKEALEVYRRTRAVLVRELGVEPGPQLRGLEQAILRGDAEIGPPRRPAEAPGLLPPAVPDLTGREAELDRLSEILAGRRAGPPVPCVISGMPGVGKSALAVRAAHDHLASFPDGQLYINLRGAGARPVPPHDALARFLRALGVSGASIPESTDERAEVYRARLSGKRVLVVLDDAADEGQVEPLIPAGAGCAVLITSRAALTALPGAYRLALGGAGRGRGRPAAQHDHRPSLRGRRRGRRRPARCAVRAAAAGPAHRRRPAGGPPPLVDRPARGTARHRASPTGRAHPRAAVGAGEPGARLLRPGRAGPDAPSPAGAAGHAGLRVLERGGPARRRRQGRRGILERLLDAQLVEYAGVDGIGEPRYRLHDLVRLHAKERLAADEPEGEGDAATIRLLGSYLALAEQAHRRQYGGDYTVLHGDAPRWDLDAATLDRLLADPAGWLRSERLGLLAAVDQAARLDLSETCWDLALTAVTLFEAQCHFEDWERTSETALAVAMHAGDVRGEAAMRHSLGSLDLFRQRYAAAKPHLDAAVDLFAAVGDRHGQALALRNAALIDRMSGAPDTALGRYRRALAMLREVGDRHAEAHVLGSIAQIHIDQGRTATAAPLLAQALAMYRELRDQRGAAQILNRTGGDAPRRRARRGGRGRLPGGHRDGPRQRRPHRRGPRPARQRRGQADGRRPAGGG